MDINQIEEIGSEAIETIFENHGVRPTAVRSMIFRFLNNASAPVSALDIETGLDTVDRSTITRTISLFTEKGLLHLIEDGSGASKYELCHAHAGDRNDADGIDSDAHVHFRCKACGRTLCLHSLPVPDVGLPAGFVAESANFTITGFCPDCSGRKG